MPLPKHCVHVSGHEERIDGSKDLVIEQILNHWIDIKGSGSLPRWSDWDWSAIPQTAIPHCGVVDVARSDLDIDLIYRFWGTAHVSAHKQELSGKSIRAMKPEQEAAEVFVQYKACYERRQPCLFTTTIHHRHLSQSIEERSLRIPFVGDDGTRVTQIFAYSHIAADMETTRRILIGSLDETRYTAKPERTAR